MTETLLARGVSRPWPRAAALPALLAVSLLLTGASGLIYQVAWFRSLGLTFGVTVHATSAVLAAFMGGLAIGSFLAARLTGRVRRPLVWYGVAEVLIGLCGIASLPAFDALQPIYRDLATALPDALTLTTVVRFAMAFGIMLLPTTLMGATLPLIISALSARSETPARLVSILYAANTFGAIGGAFTAAFYLIGPHGLTVTTSVAAALNLIVGVVWIGAGRAIGETGSAADAHAVAADPADRLPAPVALTVLISYGVSGGIALANEVVWTRILAGIYPVTVYAFALMLCAILGGIALGSWLVSPLLGRKGDWLRAFVWLEIGMALACGYALLMLGQAYRVEGIIAGLARTEAATLVDKPWYMLLFALIAIGPAALLMGVTFPVATRVFSAGHDDMGRRVGLIYGANVLGGIVGSLAAGLVLIPAFGAQNTVWLLAAGNLAAGLIVLPWAPITSRAKLVPAVSGVALFALLFALTPNLYAELFATNPNGERVEWYAEGQDATVRVATLPEGAKVLYINSAHQGSDVGSGLGFHYKLGQLGVLLHPDPQEVLVIGLGVGATAGAAATHEASKITVVELYDGVLQAARLFDRINFGVLDRPNVDVRVNDGRNFLLTTGKKYDVIEADLIQPMNAGAANLYSVDYYKLVKASLKDDGIMVQWINNGLPGFHYRMMMRSFLDVFPNATLWYNGAILVGSNSPLAIDKAALDAKFSVPGQREALAKIDLRSGDDVLRQLVAGPADLAAYAGDGPRITDRFPRIEYYKDLPFGDIGADEVRTVAAARFLAARIEPTDGIIWGHPSLRPLVTVHTPLTAESIYANSQGENSATPAAIRAMLAKNGRVWFIPWAETDEDAEIETLLNASAYKVLNRQIGQLRLTLYASPSSEPVLTPANVVFGDDLRLTGIASDRTAAEAGDVVRLALGWQATKDIDDDLKVRVRLVDGKGNVALSLDRLPRDMPTDGWRSGTRITDRYGLLIPPGTPPGDYRLSLEVYRQRDGAPLRPGGTIPSIAFTVSPTTRSFPAEAIDVQSPANIAFGDLTLVGYTLDTTPRRPGESIPVRLFWRSGTTRQARIAVGDPAMPLVSQGFTPGNRPAGSIERDDLVPRIPAAAQPGRYTVWLAVDREQPVLLGTIAVVAPPTQAAPAAPARAIGARFGDWATLVGLTTGTGEVTLVWKAEADQPRQYLTFVHLVGPDGTILAQANGVPAEGAAPVIGWQPGQTIGDRHALPIATAPPGSSVRIGFFDPVTGERVPTTAGDSVLVPLP